MNLTIEPQESFILARIEDSRLDALSAPDFKARMTGALTGAAVALLDQVPQPVAVERHHAGLGEREEARHQQQDGERREKPGQRDRVDHRR